MVLSWRNAREEEGSWKVSACPTHFPHPLPGCCPPPPSPDPPPTHPGGNLPTFFFFKCSTAHFSRSDGQPGGNVHGRHKPLHFLIHTRLSFSLCVAPEELHCPHAQQPGTLTNSRAMKFIQWKNKVHVFELISSAF